MKFCLLFSCIVLAGCQRQAPVPVPSGEEAESPLPRPAEEVKDNANEIALQGKGLPHATREALISTDWQTSACAFSPDNKYLVLGSRVPWKKNLGLWGLSTGKIIRFFERNPRERNEITKIFCLPGGKEFISLSNNGFMKSWRFFQSTAVASFDLGSDNSMAALHSDGKQLLLAAPGPSLKNVDVTTGKPLWTIEDLRPIKILLYPNGKDAFVRESKWDKEAKNYLEYEKVLAIETGKLKAFDPGNRRLLEIPPHGNLAIMISRLPDRFLLVDWPGGKIKTDLEYESGQFSVGLFAFNRANTRLYGVDLSPSPKGTMLRAWDLTTGKQIWSVALTAPVANYKPIFNKKGQQINKTPEYPRGLCFSPDAKYLLVQLETTQSGPPRNYDPAVSTETRVYYSLALWDVEQGKEIRRLEYPTDAMVDDPVIKK